jgi:hypothetical protein
MTSFLNIELRAKAAVAQAVRRRLPAAVACVRVLSQDLWDLWWIGRHWGRFFSQYCSFPCHSFVPPVVPQSSPSITQGWYNRPIKNGVFWDVRLVALVRTDVRFGGT